MSSSDSFKLHYENCLQVWGNASSLQNLDPNLAKVSVTQMLGSLMANQLVTSQTDAHAWSMVNLMNRLADSSVLESKLSDRVVISWFVWKMRVSGQSEAAV